MEQEPKPLNEIEESQNSEENTRPQIQESETEIVTDKFPDTEKDFADQQELISIRESLGLYARSPEKEKELTEDVYAKTRQIESDLEELSQTISRNGLQRISFDFKRTNPEEPVDEKMMRIKLENLSIKISRISLPEGNDRLKLETRNIQQVMESLENLRRSVSGLDDLFEKEFSNLSESSKKVLSKIRKSHSFLVDAVSLLRRLRGR